MRFGSETFFAGAAGAAAFFGAAFLAAGFLAGAALLATAFFATAVFGGAFLAAAFFGAAFFAAGLRPAVEDLRAALARGDAMAIAWARGAASSVSVLTMSPWKETTWSVSYTHLTLPTNREV